MRRLGAAVAVWLFAGFLWGQQADHGDVEAISPPSVKPQPGEKVPDLKAAVEEIVSSTNDFRKRESRQPVRVQAELAKAAQAFADYMATNDRYGHTADGKHPAERAKEHGYSYCIVLENIAYQYSSAGFTTAKMAEQFFAGWKNSAGHRRNMLDMDVTETGVAIARSEKTGYYYAVQMFGRPRSLSITFRLANEAKTEVKYSIDEREYTLPPGYTRTHEQCRPPSVKLLGVEGEGPMTARPKDGDRFALTGEGGGVRLRKKD